MSHAYPYLKRAQEMDANNLQTRLKLGLVQLATGDNKAARDQALFILEKDPKFPEATSLLAQTIKTSKDAETIRQRLDSLAKQNGVTAETEVAFGILAFQAGRFDEAEARFAHAQTLNPKSAGAFAAAGSVSWAKNNLTNADFYLKQAAELSPLRSPHRLGYANFKLKIGDLDEGARQLTEITRPLPIVFRPGSPWRTSRLPEDNFKKASASSA